MKHYASAIHQMNSSQSLKTASCATVQSSSLIRSKRLFSLTVWYNTIGVFGGVSFPANKHHEKGGIARAAFFYLFIKFSTFSVDCWCETGRKKSENWTLFVQNLDTLCSKITHITGIRSAFRKDFYKTINCLGKSRIGLGLCL